MKKLTISILAFLLFSIGAHSQCFSPVWTEPSLDSMLIYVSLARYNGTNLQVGDEVGVFDDTTCVGVGVLTQELTGAPIYLVIEVSRDNPLSVIVDGFTDGNTISYRFCSGGEEVNPAVTPTYISNGPDFSINDSCIVELRADNAAPVITSAPDTLATEDVLYSSAIMAVDIDRDSLIYSAPLLPTWLSFNDTTHVLSGIPVNENVGIHTVTLRVSDGTATVDTTFSIRVANTNDAPIINSVPDTLAVEDVLYSSSISASDIDGDSLIYSAPLLPLWLSFNDTTRVLSGTPGNDEVGTHNVTLRVFDGTVDVDTSFILYVENVNDTPVFTFIPDTLALEDELYTSVISATDIDIDDTLIFSAPVLPAWLIFNDTTNVLSGIPENDDVGDHDVTLRIFDGTISVDTAFVIQVANVNDAPAFTLLPDTLALEDALYTSAFTAEDPDGDTLAFSVPLLPSWLSFNDTTNTLSGTPLNEDVGDHPITLRINDGTVDADSTFIIRVLNVNDDPAFTSVQDTTGQQGVLYTYTATAEDVDWDSLTFSAPVLPIWLSFDTATHTLSGIPGNDHVGDNSVVLMINDGIVDVIQSFIIDVENVNDPPAVTSVPITEARPGAAYTYTITAVDIDGDSLTYTALVLPGWLLFDAETHTLAATPGEEDIGDQFVTIRVSDGSLYTDHTFIITVDDGNHAPTFISDPATTVVVGEAYVYTLVAQDIDGDSLRFSAPQLPGWLTFYPETNVVSGIPGSSDIGRHDVVLRVSDGMVSSDQRFPIFVEDVNTAPSFTSIPVTSVSAGDLYVYIAEAEDADGDDLYYTALTLPGWLSFDENTQNLHGTPTNEDAGDHNVSLRVSDGEAAENQHFVVTVDFVYGIAELSSDDGILIYPNPSNGLFFIELSGELETEISLELMDPTGRILWQEEYPPYVLIHKEIHLNNSYPGLYLIRISDKSSQTIRKLIVN